MTTRSISRLFIPLLLLLATSTGCLFGTPDKPPIDQPVQYKAYYADDEETAIANLIDNFVLAWENLDLPQYRDSILYNGVTEASDGNVYNAFIFYYDPNADEGEPYELPDTDTYERELQRVTKMFGGLPGEDYLGEEVPGIRSISLTLLREGPWRDPSGGTVEDDIFPPGTKEGFFETDMTIQLKGTYGDNTTAWNVEDRLRFNVIPVHDPDSGLYRYKIWKWRDIIVLDG